ncbi:gp53-like domain-containing protein [Citrobacter tructae]|uniref:Putative tail fiber protein gp53-like C-terminal domain-containing protein n=1 Tax=Citrobacter tructae TaxID=2562449 RepID=A0ABX5T4G5_9ENTR|nr:hypothetical protein [Citrobacter tructae]QBX80169.1 hypothetical protein E4Z61_07265 [Citrobacter tructae]
MPTNDIKPFASAGGANVLTQAEYLALAALSTGFSSGKASSKEANKAIRQATFIASVLAQFICDKSGSDVLDDGNVAGLVTKLLSAINKTSQPLDATLTALASLVGAANKLPYFNGTDTAALTDFTAFARTLLARSDADSVLSDLGLIVTEVGKNIISAPTKVDVLSYLGITTALDGKQPLDTTLTALAALAGVADKLPYFNGADTAALTDLTAYARGLLGAPDAADSRSYLGLKSAATKDVGNGAGQVPDMSSWVSGGSPTTGWRKTPDGYIEQWGLTGATTTDVTINFPIPFPTAIISINEHDMAPSGESMSMWQFREVTLNNCVAVNLGTLIRGNPSLGSPVASGCRWFAKGV